MSENSYNETCSQAPSNRVIAPRPTRDRLEEAVREWLLNGTHDMARELIPDLCAEIARLKTELRLTEDKLVRVEGEQQRDKALAELANMKRLYYPKGAPHE